MNHPGPRVSVPTGDNPIIREAIAMNVIAKMRVQAVEDYGYNRKIKFSCVHDSSVNTGDNPENRAFTKATPSGEAWMTLDNRAVWGAFAPPPMTEHGSLDYNKAQHYVVFIDASEHSLDDVHRALAALNA